MHIYKFGLTLSPGRLDLPMSKVFDKESEMKVARASKANLFILHVRKLGPREDNGLCKLEAELRVGFGSSLILQQWAWKHLVYDVMY